MGKMSAPKVRHYIRVLSDLYRRDFNANVTIDDESYRLLDEILEKVKTLAPVTENGTREFWLKEDRGLIEDYGDYQEWLAEGCGETYEEFEEEWLSYFPDKECWFLFGAVEIEDTGYKALFMQHRIVLDYDPRREKGYPYDVHEFMQWLLESVEETITEVKAETYNSYVQEHLLPQHRTGTITRAALWNAFPEERAAYFKDITAQEVELFCECMGHPDPHEANPPKPAFTVNEFYHCCSIGYEACNYACAGLTPREQYKKYADGRDDGLGQIPPDSPEAFLEWIESGRRGGHPWEVCRGGNSTHVSLYVYHDEHGYRLRVAGTSYGRSVEAIKFYLALRKADYPVEIADGSFLASRLRGTELVGIVPEGVLPVYCESYFPNEPIKSFMNLENEEREKLLPYCKWQPIPLVGLLEGETQ